ATDGRDARDGTQGRREITLRIEADQARRQRRAGCTGAAGGAAQRLPSASARAYAQSEGVRHAAGSERPARGDAQGYGRAIAGGEELTSDGEGTCLRTPNHPSATGAIARPRRTATARPGRMKRGNGSCELSDQSSA